MRDVLISWRTMATAHHSWGHWRSFGLTWTLNGKVGVWIQAYVLTSDELAGSELPLLTGSVCRNCHRVFSIDQKYQFREHTTYGFLESMLDRGSCSYVYYLLTVFSPSGGFQGLPVTKDISGSHLLAGLIAANAFSSWLEVPMDANGQRLKLEHRWPNPDSIKEISEYQHVLDVKSACLVLSASSARLSFHGLSLSLSLSCWTSNLQAQVSPYIKSQTLYLSINNIIYLYIYMYLCTYVYLYICIYDVYIYIYIDMYQHVQRDA